MNQTIHLVSDIWQKKVAKSVLKRFRMKDPMRVCKPGCKVPCDKDDTPVVWHGGDTGSTLLFYYLCKVVSGELYEVDYTHVDQYAEKGYSLIAIGDKAVWKGRLGEKPSLVSNQVKREAAAQWDRLCQDSSKPLMLMDEDGVVRNYPKDHLDDWLLGIVRDALRQEAIVAVAHIVGFALGSVPAANVNVLGTTFFEMRLDKLSRFGRVVIEDGYVRQCPGDGVDKE